MIDTKFKDKLEKLLKKEKKFLDENGELDYIKIKDSADKIDTDLIGLLVEDKKVKEKFFIKIKDVYVFSIKDFKFFLDENKVNNSYTNYKNRIGLSDKTDFLKDRTEVVLDFPFKDCILEGGQSSEDGTDIYFEYEEEKEKTVKGKKVKEGAGYKEKQGKRKEIFFNEILAKDEIDRLFDKKALVNGKRFTKKGEEKVREIKRDEDGTIKENLIIKGNNLLALHSIKSEYRGKIKLIYIDPPYNTGGDANIFTYNNTFNHSTWLTFMKNRLEIAKDLLKKDGFISITIDHFELFYLGALADDIFGRDNRVGIVTVLHNPKGRNQAKFFSENSEFMLVYAKNVNNTSFRKVVIDEAIKRTFTEEDNNGKFRYEPFLRARTVWSREKRPKNWYPIYVSKDLKDVTSTKKEGYQVLYPRTGQGDFSWKNVQSTFDEKNKDNYFKAIKDNGKIKLVHKYYEQQVYKNVWVDKKYQSEFNGTNLLKKILGKNKFSYPKSLYAVLDTLKIMTSDDDIILDFHAGSGTTGHAVLELNKEDGGNRKFILVEQLEEHVGICNERNQKVLEQENINDSFIYFELAKWNEKAKEEILKAKDLRSLVKFFDEEMYQKYFLNYNVKIKEFYEKIVKEKEFLELDFKEQQRMFIAMLDNNQMYVNASEMKDKKFGISKEDIKLTEQFYNKK